MDLSPKADAFLRALRALCLAHQVCLSVSGYDEIQIWDYRGYELWQTSFPDVLSCNGIVDRTQRPVTEPSGTPPAPHGRSEAR